MKELITQLETSFIQISDLFRDSDPSKLENYIEKSVVKSDIEFTISFVFHQIEHDEVPVLACRAPEKCYKRMPQILEIHHLVTRYNLALLRRPEKKHTQNR